MCCTESPEAASIEAPATACIVCAGPLTRVPSAEGIQRADIQLLIISRDKYIPTVRLVIGKSY